MTAQDAFAIAFDDEVWAMDAMPGNDMPRNNLPSKPSAPSGLKKNVAAAPGADTSSGGEKSLAQHLEEGCDAMKNGHPEKCPYIKKMASDLEQSQGLSHETALQQAIGMHADAANKLAGGQAQSQQANQTATGATQPTNPQPQATPEMQEAEARQIAEQGPAAVVEKLENQTSADMFAQPKEIQTEEGTILTENVGQLAAVIVTETESAKGNPLGNKANAQIVQAQEDGTITTVGNQVLEQSEQGEGSGIKEDLTLEAQGETMLSSDGSYTRPMTAEETAVIQANPNKKEVLQTMVDIEGKLQSATSAVDREQLKNGLQMWNQMFYGEKKPKQTLAEATYGAESIGENASGEEPKDKETVKVLEFEATDDKGNKSTGVIEADSRIDAIRKLMKKGLTPTNLSNEPFDINRDDLSPSTLPPSPPTPPTPPEGEVGGPSGPNPPNNPPNPPDNQPDEDDDDSRSTLPPAPSDEEFRVGKNKYKVGGTTYTDVSGKGLLRTMLASFMAGLRGEGVITGWDRISGTWDAMKRSEKGEMVRDGIASALCRDTIANYANKDGLSDDAKMEIAVIQDMMNQANTPDAQMKAIKQFQKWKETYAKELGELNKPTSGQTFKPLPNDYKGTKPPVSILKKSEGFEADKEFGDKVAAGLQERLGILGFQIEGLEGVSVGPSATTVKFKVPPTFDITAANSKKTRESLKGAIGGTDVSSVEYAKGETDVIAITVTNPEMRNVAFSDVINSSKWKTFAKKAALPIPLGRDSSGEETMLDAATMPQTIVTGATGSGKSVFISAAINGIEMEKTPDEARIVLLDPKNEFKIQDGSPHLLFPRAGGDPDKAKASKDMADVLDSLVAIMNDRVTKIGGVIEGFDPTKNEFKGAAEHSIKQYNEAHPDDKMPHILLVFDEIANARDNATAADKARIDVALQKLTAVGRSVGVNCLLATQRDDVGSIPGIIQANCPGRITFKASPTDAKASQEAKALAGNGDYILTDKGGNKTRGRGCFISPEEEMAIPSYYRNHMDGGDNSKEPKLPQEYTDGIAQAVKNKQPISVQAIEGLEEVFKKSLPEGWTVEHEKVDGDDHWKASPPKPTRVAVPNGKKTETAETSEDWTSAGSREEAVDSLNKRLQKAKAAAWEEFKNSKKTSADRQKYTKAIEKANSELQADMEIVNSQFPEQIADGDEDAESETGASGNINEENAEEEDDELALFPKGEVQIENASKSLKKQIAKWQNAMREGEISSEEVKKLHAEALKRIKDAKKAMQDGIGGKPATREQIDAILNPPKAKPADNATSEPQAANPVEEQMSDEEKAAQEEEKENERRRNSVPPQKGYSEKTIAGSYEATERLTPKDQQSIKERFLPDGWEFVTDNGFKAPAKNKFGVIFVKDPKTGSQGRLIPDPKNPKGYKFQKDIDTMHPEYKGYVKKPDGTWELSPEAKKIEEETRLDRKQSRDIKKREEALKRFNRARFGHDEAPDNKTIVANAVIEALKLVEG